MIEPLISIRLSGTRFQPSETLSVQYQLDAVQASDIQAVEASVLWRTEGKGDEDLVVHYFERRVPGDRHTSDLRELRSFSTPLPNSPLSYAGVIVKIQWLVRVRVFLAKGKQHVQEQAFTLGAIPPARPIAVVQPPSELDESSQDQDQEETAHE